MVQYHDIALQVPFHHRHRAEFLIYEIKKLDGDSETLLHHMRGTPHDVVEGSCATVVGSDSS
jgi:hypothetical protein